MKKVDTLQAVLRKRRAFAGYDELAKLFRAGGCEMPKKPKDDYRILRIAVVQNERKLVEDGNKIGLPELVEAAQPSIA